MHYSDFALKPSGCILMCISLKCIFLKKSNYMKKRLKIRFSLFAVLYGPMQVNFFQKKKIRLRMGTGKNCAIPIRLSQFDSLSILVGFQLAPL